MAEENKKILWVDDEIDLLRAHVLFLESKGYTVTTVTNAEDAIELVKTNKFDIVLLDEMLHGIDGLSALVELKESDPGLPVIMVTKNEEESLMENAIGARIDDYLTKPVNPSQILLVCKKILDSKKITSQKISRDYMAEFNKISINLMGPMDWPDWIDIHVKLSEWDLELSRRPDIGLQHTLDDQKKACNAEFGRFIENNYTAWLRSDDRPPLSPDIIPRYVLPHVEQNKKTVLLIIDNLRLDQWFIIEPLLRNYFSIKRDYYYSIIPTATPYSRNAIFSGLYPVELDKRYPNFWNSGSEEDDISLNSNEAQLLADHLKRRKLDVKPEPKYVKILDIQEAQNVARHINEYSSVPLSALVLNFVDILAHTRSSSTLIKEMIPNEAAWRSMTRSWFEHAPIFEALQQLAHNGNTVIITTDHGSIRSRRGAKVIGDRQTSTSLRYKYGRNLKVNQKHALFVKDPAEYKLPARGVNTNYIIAKEDYYFVYPTNYHYYLNYYADSFQHGGISLEEIILPVITLEAK